MRKAFKTRKSASMGTAVLASFNVERMVGASIQDGKSSSLSDTSGMLKHHETSRLESLERYWSERTALISSHHHRELAAAQSAVRQVISQQAKLGDAAQKERLRTGQRIEELLMELAGAQEDNDVLCQQLSQVQASKETTERRLAAAEAEKAAVMAAGEVLLAELELIGEQQEHTNRRLEEEEAAHKETVHTVAVARAEKADALATAAASAAAKTEALSRLAAADGARKAVQRRLALLQEVAPKLALMTFTEEESAADTDLLAAADVALHQSIMRRSAEVTLEARAAATALSNVAQELRLSEAARIEAERRMNDAFAAREKAQEECATLRQDTKILIEEKDKAQADIQAAVHEGQVTAAALATARQQQTSAQQQAEMVKPLQEELAAAEAAAEAANKRADEESEFRDDVAQGLNEELAARDRALRRAALDRTIREAALATAQRDLEDAEAATQEAQHISDAERQQWTDQLRRLRNQEESLQKKLKAATLQSLNANRATELSAVMRQVEMEKLEKKVKDAVDALQQEQLSSEKSRKRDALEIHRLEEQIKGQTNAAVGEAAEAAGFLARAEAERRRISEKYTRQKDQANQIVGEFKQALAQKKADCKALLAENAMLKSRMNGASPATSYQPGDSSPACRDQSPERVAHPGVERQLFSSQWGAHSTASSEDIENTGGTRRPPLFGRTRSRNLTTPSYEHWSHKLIPSVGGGSSVSSPSVETQLELLQEGCSHSKRFDKRRVAFADGRERTSSPSHYVSQPANRQWRR